MTSYVPPAASDFLARLAEAPCCAAIVDGGRLDAALSSRAPAIFVLRGNGLDLADRRRQFGAGQRDAFDGASRCNLTA